MTTQEEMAIEYYQTAALQTGNGHSPKPKYVPEKIVLSKPIRGDYPVGHRTIASPGEYEASVNPYGAVSVKADNGKMLGLKLSEFEVL